MILWKPGHRLSALSASAIALLLTTTPALAEDGSNVPAAAKPDQWADYVERVEQANRIVDYSSVSGTLVADSGFRPFSDGFSFFNPSKPDTVNASVFGTRMAGPKNLDAEQMRDLIGKRVCVERRATGPCTLTLSARQWMRRINAGMATGHCYGIASTASMIHANQLTPSLFRPGASTTYDLQLAEPISRVIARNQAQQYTNPVIGIRSQMKPSAIVARLREDLQPGKPLPVLGMVGDIGGHAVTPYALYDKGDGRFDIAIYDNNYPDFRRVVRMDTVRETAEYAFFTNPNTTQAASTLAAVSLIPLADITGKQPCPFCGSKNIDPTVILSPVVSKVPLKAKVVDLDGRKLKGVEVIPPTNPWQPGQPWQFPTFVVPRGEDFLVKINAKKSRRNLSVSAAASAGQFTYQVTKARVPAGTVATLGFSFESGVLGYTSKDPRLGIVSFVDQLPDGSNTVVSSVPGKSSGKAIVAVIDEKRKRVGLADYRLRATKVKGEALHQYLDGNQVGMLKASVKTRLPRDAVLWIDSKRWSGDHPRGIRAFVQSETGTKRVKVKVRR